MRRPTCGQGCITAHDEMCRAGNSIPTRTSVLAGSQPPIGVNSTAIYCLHPPMSETMLAKTDRGTQICDCRETRNMTTCPTQTECSQTVQCILISPKRVEGAQEVDGDRATPKGRKNVADQAQGSEARHRPEACQLRRAQRKSWPVQHTGPGTTFSTRTHTQHTTIYIYEEEKDSGNPGK